MIWCLLHVGGYKFPFKMYLSLKGESYFFFFNPMKVFDHSTDYGVLVPSRGLNVGARWSEHRLLTTGLPRNSWDISKYESIV